MSKFKFQPPNPPPMWGATSLPPPPPLPPPPNGEMQIDDWLPDPPHWRNRPVAPPLITLLQAIGLDPADEQAVSEALTTTIVTAVLCGTDTMTVEWASLVAAIISGLGGTRAATVFASAAFLVGHPDRLPVEIQGTIVRARISKELSPYPDGWMFVTAVDRHGDPIPPRPAAD